MGRTPTTTVVDVTGADAVISASVPPLNAYPNPFNPQVEIVYALEQRGQVTVSVYDLRGGLVRTLCSEWLDTGEHRWTWDGRDGSGRGAPSGVYFASIATGGAVQSVRMTLVQ